MSHLLLFIQFIKFGILCFGGGYMIIPLLYTDFVEKTSFFTPDQFGNLLAISQMTPGAVSINTATYIGFMKGGITAAVIAGLGLVFPTIILATLTLNFCQKYKDSWFVKGFFTGARQAAFVMVIYAVYLFANISILKQPFNILHFNLLSINYPELGLAILITLLYYHNRFSMIQLIILSAVFGWGISFI